MGAGRNKSDSVDAGSKKGKAARPGSGHRKPSRATSPMGVGSVAASPGAPSPKVRRGSKAAGGRAPSDGKDAGDQNTELLRLMSQVLVEYTECCKGGEDGRGHTALEELVEHFKHLPAGGAPHAVAKSKGGAAGRRRRRGNTGGAGPVASDAASTASSESEEEEDFYGSVVKVFTTTQEPDYANPWQREGVESCTGSGVVIRLVDEGDDPIVVAPQKKGSAKKTTRKSTGGRGGKKAGEHHLMILTAAHVVANQTFVQVQRAGLACPDKYIASVYAVRHECDLALLAVDDTDFWKNLSPAPIGALPAHRDLVLVAGFPVGGEELSVTQGVVSRIEGQEYSQSSRRLLAVTVDAAINSGNSGGPVFAESGNLLGIAFQADDDAENIGHIVPPPVIEHFIDGVLKSGPADYQGFPSAGISYQPLTNPYLRARTGIADGDTGVLVTDVFYDNTCHGVLQRHDVITAVAGTPVALNGTAAYKALGKHARVDLDIIFTMFQCGDSIPLDIIRNGEHMKVEAVARPVNDLVPLSQYDRNPPYFIWCGLVFQPLSTDFIGALEDDDATLDYLMQVATPGPDRRQIVVLGGTLTDKVNISYDSLLYSPIERVNGEKIADLDDLVVKVESSTAAMIEFETSGKEVIVVPGPGDAEAKIANRRILKRYKVPCDRCLEHTAASNGG